jgi:hypothetical protein
MRSTRLRRRRAAIASSVFLLVSLLHVPFVHFSFRRTPASCLASAAELRTPSLGSEEAPPQEPVRPASTSMERVRVSKDGRGFELVPSGREFAPFGFNYDHDEAGRLIEDYWSAEWPKVEADFREMKELGANVIRIHLQFGKFMKGADEPNDDALRLLERIVALAERERLWLDITGLGCYHRADVPDWYDKMSEGDRWKAQVAFWRAVAGRCASSPAIFCYDLMNEPVVPGKGDAREDWLGPPFAGKHFVQFVTRSTGERERSAVAVEWTRTLSRAIRAVDKEHLITVGLVDWSLDRPGLTSGFDPVKVAPEFDFVAVHVYPKSGALDAAKETLRGFALGKPVVVEETFPLHCSAAELGRVIGETRDIVQGWIGFYWGKTPDELRRSGTIPDAMLLAWLDLFRAEVSAAAERAKGEER